MSQVPPSTSTSDVFRVVVLHPVAVTMVFLAALVFGFVAWMRLPVELMPDVSYPTMTVRTTFDGAAPQEVESEVSKPIEAQLATLDGLVKLESRSRAGQSDVVLGFDWGTDMSQASQSVREKLQTVFLTDGVGRPLLLRYDPSLEPFLRVGLSLDPEKPGAARSDESVLLELRQIAEDEIQRAIEGLPGVAAVQIRGGLERQVRVEVRQELLTARRVTAAEVASALSSSNVNLAGGSIYEGDTEYLIRTLNELETVEQIQALRIRRSDGVIVPLTDVAMVTATHKDREVVSHLQGLEAVEVEVYKEADANVVDVARRVKDRLFAEGTPMLPRTHPAYVAPGVARSIPDGYRVKLLDDQAAFIEASINNLLSTAMLGAVLAVAILFLFLADFRATLVIGLSIPVSLVVGFAPLYLLDVSLNLMSLGGLALGVGMLVDNAVVVLEAVQRYVDEGVDRVQASIRGTGEVAAAVVASTLTTVAVFFPITFVEGVAGELFGDLAVAVCASLLASLAVALFLVPMMAAFSMPRVEADAPDLVSRLHAARLGEAPWSSIPGALFEAALRDPRATWARWRARAGLGRWVRLPWVMVELAVLAGWGVFTVTITVVAAVALFVGRLGAAAVGVVVGQPLLAIARLFQRAYGRVESVYAWMIPAFLRRPGLVLGAAVLAFSASIAAGSSLGLELIPDVPQGRFVLNTALPVGTPLASNLAALAPIEATIAEHPEVAMVYATIGSDRGADAEADEGEHTAKIRVELTAGVLGEDAAGREARIMEEIRQRIGPNPRLDLRFERPALFSFSTPVEVIVTGYDLRDLRTAGDSVVEELRGLGAFRDVATSLGRGFPEIQIRYNRDKLSRMNLDPRAVATRVRDQIQGAKATTLQQTDERVDVMVQLVRDQRSTLADLRRLNVNPAIQPPIPLDAVAEVQEDEGPSEIRRVDQQRAVVVTANMSGFDLGTAGATIGDTLARLDLPDGTDAFVAGQSRELEQSVASLQFALALAIFLVYVIMAATFESVLQPFVILLSVPLAVVGVAFSLFLLGMPISIVVLIGAIVLAGVVVNNAIVFVDTVNRLRSEGLGRDEALRETGRLRLRPILITTVTTLLGLLPLALGIGEGAEIQQPLAVTVIGGLGASTLLTLVVVPVVYALLTRPGPIAQPVASAGPTEAT